MRCLLVFLIFYILYPTFKGGESLFLFFFDGTLLCHNGINVYDAAKKAKSVNIGLVLFIHFPFNNKERLNICLEFIQIYDI